MTRGEARSLSGFVNRCADEGGGRYLADPLVVGNMAWVLLVDKETGDCPPLVDEVVDFIEALDRARLRGEAVPTGCRQMLLDWLQDWLTGEEDQQVGDVRCRAEGFGVAALPTPVTSAERGASGIAETKRTLGAIGTAKSPRAAAPVPYGTESYQQWIDH
jgi:hypothetical protein